MKRVCIIGWGATGSLYAAHLSRVCEVWVFVRQPDLARALNENGLHVSGTHDFHARIRATTDASELPACDFGIVTTKAMQTAEAVSPIVEQLRGGAVLSAQHGLGCEEIIAELTNGYVMRGAAFTWTTQISQTHVKYESDASAWLGPFEPTGIPFALVQEFADLIAAGGLKAVALQDAKPAQWSTVIFNASVDSVAALTGLPHCELFVEEQGFGHLGNLLRTLINEGVRVAGTLGVILHDDLWEMNRVGARTGHLPSMLYDIQHHLPTEAEFLGAAIAREARRLGIRAPVHEALYRLIKGKEASWGVEKHE